AYSWCARAGTVDALHPVEAGPINFFVASRHGNEFCAKSPCSATSFQLPSMAINHSEVIYRMFHANSLRDGFLLQPWGIGMPEEALGCADVATSTVKWYPQTC